MSRATVAARRPERSAIWREVERWARKASKPRWLKSLSFPRACRVCGGELERNNDRQIVRYHRPCRPGRHNRARLERARSRRRIASFLGLERWAWWRSAA